MVLAPGSRFDRYRIEELLGEGGMGRVYRAYDERLQRNVALKILHAGAPGSADSRPSSDGASRLLREARAAAALDHANAVAIYDVGEVAAVAGEPSVPFIAMELILGRSLRAFVGKGDVSIAERVRWLSDVARALAAAHERGLVHRDIKPENVMIRGDGAVKVLDFGIARRTPAGTLEAGAMQAAAAATLTAEGVVVGTPFYMAPEQMRGEAVDGRADQFAWGVVAYELLTGRLPWDRSGDALKVVAQVLTAQPAPLRELAPDVPALVEATVVRAMAKAPGDRFASMGEIVQTLHSMASSSVAHALPPLVAEVLGSAATVASTRTSLASARGGEVTARRTTGRRARVAGLLAITAAVMAAALVLRTRGPAHAVGAAAAPTAPTAVTDLPPPKTTPEALAAYADGMRALREGNIAVVEQKLERVLELDGHVGPALMRLAVGLAIDRPEKARDYYSRAVQVRRTMSERDQGFLDAFEPYVQREPSDQAEARARLAALSARYPLDAEIAYDLGALDDELAAFDRAAKEYERASELDPQFLLPLFAETYLLGIKKGDFAGALAVTKRCETVAPGEPTCFSTRDDIDSQEGRCAELEADAKQMILRRPSSPLGYLYSSQALFMIGSPMGAVREAIAQARARMGEAASAFPRLALVEFNMDVLEGSFVHADEVVRARDAQPAVAGSADESVHGFDAWARVETAAETGRSSDAIALAADFRARSAAWTRPASPDPGSLRFDEKLSLLSVLFHARRLSRAEFGEARSEWLQRWGAGVASRVAPYLWVTAYARVAENADEAREALAVLPKYQPFPVFWQFPADLAIGRVYLLAGDVDSAIPYLRRASVSCYALDVPFDHVRAHLYLGEALEAKKDIAGACAAYRVVLDRWGLAKPRSLTAEVARARASAAKCEN